MNAITINTNIANDSLTLGRVAFVEVAGRKAESFGKMAFVLAGIVYNDVQFMLVSGGKSSDITSRFCFTSGNVVSPMMHISALFNVTKNNEGIWLAVGEDAHKLSIMREGENITEHFIQSITSLYEQSIQQYFQPGR